MPRGHRGLLALSYALIAFAFTLSACSDSPSTGDGPVVLTTDAETYALIPGVPPPPFTLTLRNESGAEISVTTCPEDDHTLAELQYEQLQGGTWVEIPWNEVDCGGSGADETIADAESWDVPARIGTPPVTAGTYRVVLPYSRAGTSSGMSNATSNTFVVTDNSEPT